jgi:hypothetical protein
VVRPRRLWERWGGRYGDGVEPQHPEAAVEPVPGDDIGDVPDGAGRPRRRRRRGRTLAWLAGFAVFALGVALAFDTPWGTTFLATVVAAVILRTGFFFLQSFASPPPPPPEPGKLRKVKLTYRCDVCGAEIRMTQAASEDPEPPRHCMDEMRLITPVD